jgi:hypothetical protein
MNTEADLAALCDEFTKALTEVLAENAAAPARRGRVARAHAAIKRHPEYNMHFALRWRVRSCSGRHCKTLGTDLATLHRGHSNGAPLAR